MSDNTKESPIDLGIYGSAEKPRLATSDFVAIALSALWIVIAGALLLFSRAADRLESIGFVMTLMAIFLPVAMIWVAAAAARSGRVMREESARLEAAIGALRQSLLAAHKNGTPGTRSSTVERKLEEIAAAQRKTEHAIATFSTVRQAQAKRAAERQAAMPPGTPSAEEQGRLALTTPADAQTEPVSVADFIRALHFPENADDQEGFRALRRALRDRQTAQLVQASQDVLTLLSQDGIYMDDLNPDRARPEIWRRFAQGERGRPIAALGGIRDRSSLALTAGRMKTDTVFRDSVHHFLRKFDQTFSAFEKVATDQDVAELADTRTARAFMLLGRVAGTFH